MKKIILLLLLLFFISGFWLPAQKSPLYSGISVGAGGGILLLFGDIGNMGIGYNTLLTGSWNMGNNWSFRLSLMNGRVSDSDEGTVNASRNYAYSTTLWQPAVYALYTFYKDRHRGYNKKRLVVYWDRWRVDVIGGVSFPYANVTPGNNFVPPDPSLLSGFYVAIPFGTGVQYGISQSLALRAELTPQIVLSDYLDGFSSPYSEANDFMYILTLTFVYHFQEKHHKGTVYCPFEE